MCLEDEDLTSKLFLGKQNNFWGGGGGTGSLLTLAKSLNMINIP